MKLLVLFFFVLMVISVELIFIDPIYRNIWAEYKRKYKKKYYSNEEEVFRRRVFEDYVKDMCVHNIEHELGFHKKRLEINKWSDRMAEEFPRPRKLSKL
nr:cathepsin K-like [Parasteatoda tepidariorum]